MRRMLRTISALWLIIAVIITASVLINYKPLKAVPPSLQAFKLNYCDFPCYLNIIPGQTTFGQAKRLIRIIYGDKARYKVTDANDSAVVLLYPHLQVELLAGLIDLIQDEKNPYCYRLSPDTLVSLVLMNTPLDVYFRNPSADSDDQAVPWHGINACVFGHDDAQTF